MKLSPSIPLLHPPSAQITSPDPEVVIMVGGPGSGKSNFALTHLSKYAYVNMDQLKSAPKCVQQVKLALSRKECVVVDNTNPDKKSRARFVAEAKAAGAKVRCFKMLTSKEHMRHNNRVSNALKKK
jgi:bifunctional polynucleotide phosphatase/kinase